MKTTIARCTIKTVLCFNLQPTGVEETFQDHNEVFQSLSINENHPAWLASIGEGKIQSNIVVLFTDCAVKVFALACNSNSQ